MKNVRLKNLRMLHGRAGGAGAPTSGLLADFLNERGVSIRPQEISDIYAQKREIGDYLAGQIEKAFELSFGWLSVDHEFVYALSPGEAIALQGLSRLSPEIRTNIITLITSISALPER